MPGSSIRMGWKRRSRALSRSTYLWYSAWVVAPIIWNFPRERLGFRMLAASIAPSALPAPTMVCTSSTKRMTSPESESSFTMRRSRSSNSPRYLVPATRFAVLSWMMRFSLRGSGAAPDAIFWASPSTMAVLPTPGSPIRTGLLFVRRHSAWMTRRISRSRPMTGSSSPSRAFRVRSTPS